jgi:hypothetical protein
MVILGVEAMNKVDTLADDVLDNAHLYEDDHAGEQIYTAKFFMQSKDYGMSVFVKAHSLDSSPNQADLRNALDAMINAIGNWDNFDIIIKSERV